MSIVRYIKGVAGDRVWWVWGNVAGSCKGATGGKRGVVFHSYTFVSQQYQHYNIVSLGGNG